ncbi:MULTISPECIES: transposase [Nitrosomonas]|uniref:DDE superfamily endonuclease n=2 Tax=Nitrosomonas communis TaxID=44574 RepID=A0A5D3Y809_9PROT|nr:MULTISPECIES: transposase [Nitrosomonas]TYP78709.1 DDE superfamily endonuclease [Nitrosomonas communis]UVS60467.1 transposase [Nitrosomonas sp. PLL12]
MPHTKSGGMAAIFTCSKSSVEGLAKSGRPCMFHGWARQELLPELPSHAVVVMDNATFHQRQDMRDAIQNAGHTLEYLPAYSPDLNPNLTSLLI